ncbi:MAG: D-alanyl-D-alanine carboxypeptidase family protein, partial [Hyphococcus sp.]
MRLVVRGVTLMALALAFFAGFSASASANSKYAAYVMHADSGDVLFNRYSTSRRYPASLTKMMTLYLLFEELEAGNLSLDSKLTVSKRASGQPPSKLGLTTGSTIDVETAIQALVVKSANDVAVVVAEHIAGSEWRFAQKMTAKARALGMSRTTFRNASGLPNSKQVTTARDMAVLGRRVMQDFPQYFDYFATKKFTWNGKTYSTHNALVRNFEGADGIKTGYTRSSGFNLVT